MFAQIQEQDEAKNPDAKNAVIAAIDTDELTVSGTYVIPAEQTISSDGSLKIVATSYLQSVSIVVGTGSPTFKSATLESYLLEVLMYLQFLEGQTAKNPQGVNNITGSFNSDTRVYQGTFNIPVALAIANDGSLTVQADEYLLT